MVILAKPSELRQTETTLFMSIPFQNKVSLSEVKPEVFCSQKYLKVSFRPYLLEMFWQGNAKDEGESACRVVIKDGSIFIEVDKLQVGMWEHIAREGLSACEKASIRAKMLDRQAEFELRRKEDRLRSTNERVRKATMEALEKEEEGRAARERVKKEAIKRWSEEEKHEADNHDGRNFSTDLAAKVALENERLRNLPPPSTAEETRVISVQFSASRIDKIAAKKNINDGETMEAELRTNVNKESLLQRGREHFESGEFAEAIKVFSRGIKFYPKHASFYNNRSACRLKVGDLRGCILDASAAIDVLKVVEGADNNDQTQQQLCKALARRGAALAELGLKTEAGKEFEAAEELWPGRKKDIQRIKNYMLKDAGATEYNIE